MKTKIITSIIVLIAAVAGFTLAPAPSALAADNCSADVCSSSKYPDSVKAACGCTSTSTNALKDTVIKIINAIIGVIGVVAVIFVIIGGINYMTSAGDAGKLKKAKDTILYACIGLAICVLSFAIVNFVISKIIP